MKRFLVFLAALLALAIAAAGCNASVTPPAAVVGGTTIAASELNAALTNLKSDTGFICTSTGGTQIPTSGVAPGTWSTTFADDVLTQLVKYAVLDQMLAAHHLVAPASDYNEAKLETEESVESTMESLEEASTPVTCPGSPTSIVGDLGSAFGTRFIDNQANVDAYSAYLAGTTLQPSALTAWDRHHTAVTTESCTSAIGFSSKKAALAAKAAIAAGTSFATEAGKSTENIGAGTGGAIGCITKDELPSSIGQIIAGLPIDAVSQPVSYDGIYLIFTVTKRQLQSLSDLVTHIDTIEQAAFSAAYAKALAAARISVASAYGSFQVKAVSGGFTAAVVPPSDKACSFALSASAAGCS